MADAVNQCIECRAPVGPDERLCAGCNQQVDAVMSGLRRTLWEDALVFALEKHEGQSDIHGHAYGLHVLRVMAGLSRRGVNQPEALAAAALHDVVEDCGVALEEISQLFGERVYKLVDLLTHRDSEPYAVYIERIDTDRVARAIKLADLEDNTLAWRAVPNGKKQAVYPAAIVRLESGEWPESYKE